MKKKILILNGPNLNLLGTREPDVYGSQNFESFFTALSQKYADTAVLSYFQSNVEGALIDILQETGPAVDGIVLNPAAYGHTSIALADTLAAIRTPVIEVHISNIYKREPFRHHTYTSARAAGLISGLGLKGYELAINYFLEP